MMLAWIRNRYRRWRAEREFAKLRCPDCGGRRDDDFDGLVACFCGIDMGGKSPTLEEIMKAVDQEKKPKPPQHVTECTQCGTPLACDEICIPDGVTELCDRRAPEFWMPVQIEGNSES